MYKILNLNLASTDEQESGEGVSEPEITSGTPSTGVNEDDINGVNNRILLIIVFSINIHVALGKALEIQKCPRTEINQHYYAVLDHRTCITKTNTCIF